jgi:hypothetical protein
LRALYSVFQKIEAPRPSVFQKILATIESVFQNVRRFPFGFSEDLSKSSVFQKKIACLSGTSYSVFQNFLATKIFGFSETSRAEYSVFQKVKALLSRFFRRF